MAKRRKRQLKGRTWFVKRGKIRWTPTLLALGSVLAAVTAVSQTPLFAENTKPTLTKADERQLFLTQKGPYAQLMQQQYGVLASITLAQAALESDWGKSGLSREYNNYFGIKSDGSGDSVLYATKEFENQRWITVNARFAVYRDWRDSFRAHSQLLVKGTTWNANQYQDVLNSRDYRTAAQALVKDGYATDPAYAQKLIQIIEQYDLARLD